MLLVPAVPARHSQDQDPVLGKGTAVPPSSVPHSCPWEPHTLSSPLGYDSFTIAFKCLCLLL